MDWLIDPDGLYELLVRLSKDAPGLPLYITENGCAAEDYINPDGEVNDLERVKFLHQHLDACARAARDGVNLAGYYVWSLLDNFEWAYGYQKRFGIVYVDFATQQRIPKASAAFFARVASENSIPRCPPPGRCTPYWVPSTRASALATSAARPSRPACGRDRPASSVAASWSGGSPGSRPGRAA